MSTLNVGFISNDLVTLNKLNSNTSYSYQLLKNSNEVEKKLRDVDIFLFDMRYTDRAFPLNQNYIDEKKPIALALIDLRQEQRDYVLSLHFDDYISYPINSLEVSVRLKKYESLPNSLSEPFRVDPLLERCCDYMLANLAFPFQLETLCKTVGTNSNTLIRKFKLYLHMTPMAWLREQRLIRAYDRVRYSSEPISQIAYRFGYENPANFSTSFRDRFSETPTKVRKLFLQKF
ncbi:helix-turn-helix domain-containing protein [Marinomonas fungiae]|uniref:helix-turn-helix domain-containing protein n=1 Tax=Marinomonas fungiae TaxID=1137284 RepID=UPI003A8E4660